MSSKSESGHAKNVANFETLISFVTGFGEKYKPVKSINKLPFLQTLLTEAATAVDQLSREKVKLDAAINKRARTFLPLQKLSTRLVASYNQVAEPEEVDDLKTHHRKIRGSRAIKKPKPKPGEEQQAEAEQPEHTEKTISVSQRSFDSLVEHFSKMIDRLESHADYKPNEPELQVDALNTLLNEMKAANTAVTLAATPYKNALIARNSVLYKPKTGLKEVADSVKQYVMSVYGHRTPEHRLVTGLEFTRLKES